MARARSSRSIPPKRIMVVDDEPSVANIIRMVLGLDGHQVEIAEDGKIALSLYEKGKYDLVITDFKMPNMDGLELVQAIRERCTAQPIILITAHADALRNQKDQLVNVNYMLAKPFVVEQLREALVALFPGA